MKKTPVEVALGDVPEVIDFIDARDALREYMDQYPYIFQEYRALVERYNTTLENAEKVCRAREVSCGPLDLFQYARTYDPEALFNAVGKDKFLQVGGTVREVPRYEIDRGLVEAAVSQGKIPAAIVPTFCKDTPKFHTPDKIVLP